MAKDKKEPKIYVVKPKIGENYYFKFAGILMYGQLVSVIDSLTKLHGVPHYWMNEKSDKSAKKCVYPISIYKIFKDLNDTKNV
jgi:hypothetical protein